MLKLLRQYNQWILVVGGTLLLIAFLMPSAIQGLAQRSAVSGATWATYAGGTATGADLEEAQKELRVVEVLQNRVLNQLGATKEPAHWWLLVHEAREAGLVGGEGEGEAAIAQIAAASGIAPEQALFNISRASGTNRDVVLTTLAKVQGVMRLMNLSVGIDRVSDQRLKRSIARALLAVSGDLVVIDARKNTTIDAAAPTEERLNEQLKKFADKARPADNAIGMDSFGYRTPDRVKIEWITISKADVAKSVANSPELATLALKKRFAQDPKKYGGTDASGFAALETTVRAAVTEELVKARVDEIAKFTGDQLGLAQRSLKRDGAYFVLPADWTSQMPALQALAQTVASEFAIPAPTYQSSGEKWLSVTDMRDVPGLGTSRTSKFGAPASATQIAFNSKELSNPNIAAPVQANIASPALTADNGDVCFFRIIAAEGAKTTTDLAAVRADVEKDVLALARFEWLDSNKDAIAAQAAADGIRTVADKFGSKVEFAKDIAEANPNYIGYGIRMGSGLAALNNDPKAIAAIIDRASKIPFAADMNSVPIAQRTIAVPVPGQLSLAVLQITSMTPVTQERYGELAGAIMAQNGSRIVEVTRDPELAIDPIGLFGYDALAKRYSFKQSRAKEDMPKSGAPVPPLDPAT